MKGVATRRSNDDLGSYKRARHRSLSTVVKVTSVRQDTALERSVCISVFSVWRQWGAAGRRSVTNCERNFRSVKHCQISVRRNSDNTTFQRVVYVCDKITEMSWSTCMGQRMMLYYLSRCEQWHIFWAFRGNGVLTIVKRKIKIFMPY